MLPVYQTFTAPNTGGAGPTPIPCDWMKAYPAITVGLYIVSGTATFGVQYTLDDLNSNAANARWFDVSALPRGTTTAGTALINFPIRGLRLYLSQCSGTVEFKIIQPPN